MKRTTGWSLAVLMALGALQGCATEAPQVRAMRPAADGFCDLSDEAMRKYVVVVNAPGRSNGTGFATVIDGQLYVITNRHNLPEEFGSFPAEVRNRDFARTPITGMVAGGRDYAETEGLHHAEDFAVLTVQDPSILYPLPLLEGRHQGDVVVPAFPDRVYAVGRGQQWHADDWFDMLDFPMNIGASGAPVLDCRGYVTGLYTAYILPKDWELAGFKGLSTPISRVLDAMRR